MNVKKTFLVLALLLPTIAHKSYADELPADQLSNGSAPVNIPCQLQEVLLILEQAMPGQPWSESFKNACAAIKKNEGAASYTSIMELINESLQVVEAKSDDPLFNEIRAALQEYKKAIDLSDQDISQDELITRKGKYFNIRAALTTITGALDVRGPVVIKGPLVVNNSEVVNGSLTVNGDETVQGTLRVNGALLVNGAASPGASGTVTSVTAGNGITVTGNPTVNPTVSLSTPVSIANGGTNTGSFANTDGVVYFDGTMLNTTPVGTSGQVLTSNGGTAPAFADLPASTISITGDTGGQLTGNSFFLTGGSTGLTFNGSAGTTETLEFAGITANGGPVNLATDGTNSTVNVGTGAGQKTVTVGSTAGGSSTTVQSSGGGLNLNSNNGTLTINSETGTINISTDNFPTTLNIANSTVQKTVTIGSTALGSTTTLQSGMFGGLFIPAFAPGVLLASSNNGQISSNDGGNAGYVLTSNGPNTTPSFEPASSGGVQQISGDTGTANGSVIGLNANTTAGASVKFTASGSTVTLNATDSLGNTSFGLNAGNANGASQNSLFGASAGHLIAGGTNCGFGYQALAAANACQNTCAFGWQALNQISGGSNNVAVGAGAGSNYTAGESNNINIGLCGGTAAESNTTRIGFSAANGAQQQKCFIDGIRNITTTNNGASVIMIDSAGQICTSPKLFVEMQGVVGVTTPNTNAIPVLIDSGGNLGTVSSSRRYKENIRSFDSSAIIKANPVVFNYKTHNAQERSYGLIAEEMAELIPDLVVYKDGQPETIKYHELPVFLLAQIKVLDAQVKELKERLNALEERN